ncbi:MAG TPA: heavy metal-associated domain-containing protein [Bryobacteraceae bacterium]|nr:heavy metal-associated domain-containing protein [Bryobacteraceae bacterium]
MTCAYAVRVGLMKVPGVESVDVSLNKGLATVRLKAGNTVRPAQLWNVIRRNGNTPKTTRVSVRGEVLGAGDQFRVSGSNEVFPVSAAPGIAQQLKATGGRTVTVDGALTPGKDAKAIVPLQVEAVRQ